MDLRVRRGDQAPEPSVEESVVAEAEESKTVEVQNQAHTDRVLRRERNRPYRVLGTGSNGQPAYVYKEILRRLLRSVREKKASRLAASPGQRASSQCPEHPSVSGREKRRRAESSSLLT